MFDSGVPFIGFAVLGYVFWFLVKNKRPLIQFIAIIGLSIGYLSVVLLDIADTYQLTGSWVTLAGIILPIAFGMFMLAGNVNTQRVGTERQKKTGQVLIPVMAAILTLSLLSVLFSRR